MQASVNQKYNLVVATHTINRNDRKTLSAITIETKENLSLENFTILVDKGYHNGKEIQTCQQANITTIVAVPEIVNSNQNCQSRTGFGSTTTEYLVSNFVYNKLSNTYTCPAQQTLNTTGNWHTFSF